jgi:TonB-dependent starch-binding outer membrane protein SusC
MSKLYLSVKWPVVLLFVCLSGAVWAQNRTITGKVTSSDDGSALPGVNILEKGTTNGTVTDANGAYSVNVGSDATLVFSFVGYLTQEVSAGAQSNLDIILQVDVATLNEVVVIGYGEVQKKDVTGAVSVMSNRDFNKGVLASPQDLIVGKFAGVTVTSAGGAPGASSTIRIRGGASLTANNDPLIVIDGFPVDATAPSGLANPLTALNPNDIESFTVLKDASATAIYGSRASNGVIIITTKKGKKGKLQLNYNGTVSVATPMKYLDVMNAAEFKAFVDAREADGIYAIDASAKALLGDADTNWQKEIFRTAISSDHNVSASGSIKSIPYRISYGYTDQQGILKTTSLNRHSLNINVNPILLDGDLTMNFSIKGSHTTSNFGDEGAVGNAVSFDPTQPVRDGNESFGGFFSWLSKGTPKIVNGNSNPVAMLEQTDNSGVSQRIIANAQVEYKLPFLRDLKAVLNLGFDHATSDGHNRAPLESGFLHNNGTLIGRDNIYSGEAKSELLDFYLNYSKVLTHHKIDFTAGYGYQHFYRTSAFRNVNALVTDEPLPSPSENFLISFFGRLNYTFKGRYLLTATLRDDGTSRVSPDNRWGLFPSVALGWQLKDEAFLSGVASLSDLKLRAGYGVTGQQDVLNQYYPYLAVYRSSNTLAQYQLGNTFYTTQRPEAYDPNIKWEETTTYNLGLDFGFYNDRITGTIEVFQKNTVDLLNNIGIPNGVNFSNFLTTNVGSMENKGIEITLSAIPVQTQDLIWNLGVNFTSISSNITKLNLTDDPTYPGVFLGNVGVGANVQNHRVGHPASSFYVFQQVYDEAGKPVEGLFVDRSGKGGTVTANEDNKYHFHRPVADYTMGLNSRVNYKKFDFSFSSRLSVGNYVYNNVEASRAFKGAAFTQGHFRNVPNNISDADFVGQQVFSDYYVQDASFFKMDNISAGYNFDNLAGEKLKVRLSLTVQNAFIISEYKGLDPEVESGIDNNFYPRPRTFLVGVNVTF